ncbi:MAG: hypothetical protein HY043_15330 [Verrucomicrobia bacterium]|nr:hypothetical protein [Verrucomicrobiota bacterium]
MDEPIPGAAPVESTSLPVPYKDRSTGLIVFGILTIMLGCLAGLFVPLMLIGQAAAAKAGGAPTPLSALLPAMLLYASLAVALVWLGIGSILARRWARALLLIFSWSWLGLGLIVLVFMAFLLPKILANFSNAGAPGNRSIPPAAMVGMMVGMFLVFGVLFVILPAVWTFFYRSRHVKATCETRDPVIRWTDACPLPVLGFCLWLMFSVPMMLIMPLAGHGVMPFFGMFLTGMPGTLFCLAVAAIWGYAAWSLYKLERRGWWLMLIALCVFMLSSFLTFAQHDVLEMYQLMGYPQAQIDQLQKSGFLVGNSMTWLMACSVLPFLGYLLFIGKFLRGKS